MDIVLNALADGAVVVTANARAARALKLIHAGRQQQQGHTMWATPAIFDWDSWLSHLWQQQVFSDHDAPLLLTPLQEHTLWMRVQERDAHLVVWPDGLASLAQSAYQRLSGYEMHLERNSVWLEPDAEHFRQWVKAFDLLCHTNKWASRSDLESLLLRTAQIGPLTVPEQILIAGFDRFTPAQQDLLQRFREAGIRVDVAAPKTADTSGYILVTASDARDELLTCVEWCRHKLENNSAIRIGVIAPDVGSIRSEADRIFRRALMPQSLDLANEAFRMPFEFSLGVPLATVPIVRAALLLLRWIIHPMLEEDLSWILLSGFFQTNRPETLDLAQLVFKRRDFGMLSPEVSINAFIHRYASSPLSNRLGQVLKAVAENEIAINKHTYTHWSDLTQQLLRLAEWPGYRPPDSVQFQAQQRWLRALDEISLLDFSNHNVSFSAFLQILERHANEVTFTPESHDVPIQILGALESSGQTFDAIWFLGIDDAQWPQAGRPHPLLPIALQRRAKMPHCDTATDTELAIAVTRRILESAEECIFSYSRQNKEGDLRPSPVLAAIFNDTLRPASTAEFRRQIGTPEPSSLKPQAESAIFPSQIEPWPVDRIAGGADVLKDQAACPFRAFAKRRLGAQPLNRTEWGLDAAQRGSLLHAILETIWSPDTPDAFRIISPDDLRHAISVQRLDDALRYHIGNAFRSLVREHADDTWMQAYLESEQQRLLLRLRDWMQYEAKRQPFIVDKREERLKDANVGELKLNLRADRIDKLPDGSHLLIDYKTGEVSTSAWKGDRPDEPQLPLYAAYGNVEHVSGLLFAQIRAGKIRFVGRAANAQQNVLTDLTASSSLVSQPFDDDMHDAWQKSLLQLAEEFLHGEASVDPKHNPDTCTYCPLPGLCRVAEAGLASEPDDVEAGDA